MVDPHKQGEQDELEFDPLDPNSATRVAPRTSSLGGTEAPIPTSSPEPAPKVDRQAATKVVSTPVTRPAAPPLKIDFAEVLGKSREAAGAHRIGANALEMGDFQSKYDKQALERAQAAPKFELPNTLEDDIRNQPVRVVEKRGSVWLRTLLVVLIPAVLAVGGVFIYLSLRASNGPDELERMKKADEIHRKAALEREKEMAR
ncbi:MAG: hypothetical protein QM765_48810 [Myxococcales bacterium]